MKKIICFVMCCLILSACSNDINRKMVVKKDGVELKVKLDKERYSINDKIVITATATNKSNRPFTYGTRDSCDVGYDYYLNPNINRLMNIEAAEINGRNTLGMGCLMSGGESTLQPNAEKVLKIVLTPKEFTDDKYLYNNEKLTVSIDFVDRKVSFNLPVSIEKKKKNRNIPSNAQEATDYYRKDERLVKWAKERGFEMDKVKVMSFHDYQDYWLLSYYVPIKMEGQTGNSYIEIRAENDTAKIIEAKYQNEDDFSMYSVIIPRMVLRTSFEKELKNNTEKYFRVSMHNYDFNRKIKGEIKSENDKEIESNHIKTIEIYNGEILEISNGVFTYEVKMKGKDILKIAKDKQWEYIEKDKD